MKYFRFKLVGFGLAVLGGSVLAADDGQLPANGKRPESEKVVQNSPGQTRTATVQFNASVGSLHAADPLWFSASKSGIAPIPVSSANSGAIPASALGVAAASEKVQTAGSHSTQTVVECSCASPTTGIGEPAAFSPREMGMWSLQPLPPQLLVPWKRSTGQLESWPPTGPLIGTVPPGLLSPGDLPPISEPPGNSKVVRDPVPAVSSPPEVWSQPLNNTPRPNALTRPVPLENQATPPVMTKPQPTPPLPSQAPVVTQSTPPPAQLPMPQLPKNEPAPQTTQPTQPTQQLPMPLTLKDEVVPQPTQPTQQLPTPQMLKNEVTPQPLATQPIPQPPQTNVLPQPRTLDSTPHSPPGIAGPDSCPQVQPQVAADLPVAPPNLMVPRGGEVPGKNGVFGSEPIRISKDYPSLSDLCGTPIRDRLDAAISADREHGGGERGYIQGEYLMWWVSGVNVPVLATTSTSPTGTGFLGQPGTVPVIGSGTFLGSARDGLRLRAGYWLDDCNCWGIDGSVFFLGQRDSDAAYGSNQYPVLTRPVYSPNTIPGTGIVIGETGEAVSVPGVLSGALTVHAQSTLWGGDVNLSRCLFSDCNTHATFFVGYRNLDLSESVTINENIEVVGSGGNRIVVTDPIGTLVNVQDRFATQNYFNGGQIGGTYERRWGNFDLDARASIAFGVTDQELDISGFQTKTFPGGTAQSFRGGLLAAGPNLGDFSSNRFSVAPEVTVNARYWLLPNLKVHVGYNFLYWTNVIRPGNQIDSVVNLANVPNSPTVGASNLARPEALFQQSNLVVHGVQFGLEWRW